MNGNKKSLMLAGLALLTLGACDDGAQKKDAAPQAGEAVHVPPATQAAVPENIPVPGALVALRVSNARSFATAEGMATGAIFIDIANGGTGPDRLIGASTGKAVRVELHESAVDTATGVMAMRKVDGIDLPAGTMVSLAPGGYHIMLFDLPMPLQEGETYDVTLAFEKAEKITVPVTVVAPGSAAATHNHIHGDVGDEQPAE